MKYIIAGPTIVNDVVYADGSRVDGMTGGAVFCAAGLALWSDSILYVSNVGPDFESYYGRFMDAYGFSRAGLRFALPYTNHTTLVYRPDGLHDEISVFSPDVEAEIDRLEPITARQVAEACADDTVGIYVEARESSAFWDDLPLIREATDAKLLWELPTSAATEPQRRAATLAVLPKCDLFSLNLMEARILFRQEDEAGVARVIREMGLRCYLRLGARGSRVVAPEGDAFVPSVTVGPIVDATGCGNASTAAALYGFCEGFEPRKTAAIANLSAAYTLLQVGPCPAVAPEMRLDAERRLDALCSEPSR